LPISSDQKLTLGDVLETEKRSALEEAEEPEPKERIRRVLKLTEGLRLIEAGIKVFEDTDSNEQRAAKQDKELRANLLAVRRSEGEVFLARRQCLISSSHIQRLVHRYLHFYWRLLSR
jgi:hypothetical protein